MPLITGFIIRETAAFMFYLGSLANTRFAQPGRGASFH